MKIKEKVLTERKVLIEKTLGEYSKERGEPFLFNYATIQEFGLLLLEKNFAEVNKVIDEWKINLVGMLNMKDFHNKDIEVPLDIEDIEELKQKLGIEVLK